MTPGPAWRGLPESLAAKLPQFDPAAFGRALDQAVIAAMHGYAAGVDVYRRHPYRRPEEVARAVWARGSSVLLDHGRPAAARGRRRTSEAALFVPSLINRGWVLDLIPGQGMLSWLALNGVRPFRMEWGAPGDEERRFGVADYIRERLEPALDHAVTATGGPVMLVGYCMGGLLALAAAIRRPDAVSGLALLATPWDFHVPDRVRAESIAAIYQTSRPMFQPFGEMPVEALQALFAMQDPIVALRKFRRFAAMDPESAEARSFVALEDWLNDGVALTLPVADDSLAGWYGANRSGRREWQVDGATIDPGAVKARTLLVVPGADRIVPPASAAALAGQLPKADRLDLALGHIGMVVGRSAEQALWRPLAAWMCSAA